MKAYDNEINFDVNLVGIEEALEKARELQKTIDSAKDSARQFYELCKAIDIECSVKGEGVYEVFREVDSQDG